jgi:hypothetical protein
LPQRAHDRPASAARKYELAERRGRVNDVAALVGEIERSSAAVGRSARSRTGLSISRQARLARLAPGEEDQVSSSNGRGSSSRARSVPIAKRCPGLVSMGGSGVRNPPPEVPAEHAGVAEPSA